MVNGKAVVAVLVVMVVLTVGGIAGAALLGTGSTDDPAGDSTDSATDRDGAPSTATAVPTATTAPTGTPNGTAVPSTATAGPTATATGAGTASGTVVPSTPTATPPPSQREAMLPRRFDERAIEREIRRLVNTWREDQGLPAYGVPNGTVTARLDRMADAHSVAMADHGTVAYEVNGTDVVDRYEDHDLLGTCRFKRADKQYVVTPKNYRFESLGRTFAGRAYEDGDGYRYNENETQVARAVFEEWTEGALSREPLTFENANRLGVGIEITETNEVYATGSICGSGK